jgi:hypothetical protein
VRLRGVARRGQTGTDDALLAIEAPTLDLEDLPCAP